MPLHNDEQFLTAVAAALGESIGLIRRRGFHIEVTNDDPSPRKSGRALSTAMPDCDDPVDLATLGIDWDPTMTPGRIAAVGDTLQPAAPAADSGGPRS